MSNFPPSQRKNQSWCIRWTSDPVFLSAMQSAELDAWNAFVVVVTNFLGNTKAENYRLLVGNLSQAFQMLWWNMTVKIHFLHSHMDYFPDNLGAVSKEQGERFHQDIKTMGKRYQAYWSKSIMADYCWRLIRECTDTTYSRRAKKRKLLICLFIEVCQTTSSVLFHFLDFLGHQLQIVVKFLTQCTLLCH